jgi:uncharacterized protein (UPF0335 family)
MSIEQEIKLLQEDKKQVLAEFKDRVDPKAFRVALNTARSKAKLKPHESNEYDQIIVLLESALCVDNIQ